MMFKYEIKGITLNELELMDIAMYYNICRTAEYLMERYDMPEEKAMKWGADIRRYMDKYNETEDIAIFRMLEEGETV